MAQKNKNKTKSFMVVVCSNEILTCVRKCFCKNLEKPWSSQSHIPRVGSAWSAPHSGDDSNNVTPTPPHQPHPTNPTPTHKIPVNLKQQQKQITTLILTVCVSLTNITEHHKDNQKTKAEDPLKLEPAFYSMLLVSL